MENKNQNSKNQNNNTEKQIDLEINVRDLGDRELEALTAQLDHNVPDIQFIRSE